MKKTFIGFLLVVLLGFNPFANATLWDRGGGLVYDDDLKITWLQDPYYAGKELTSQRINEIIAAVGSIGDHTLTLADFSSEYSERMTWWGAMAWASQLVYQSYDDWRLPTTRGTSWGALTEGEMGHLWLATLEGVTANGPFGDFGGHSWYGTEYALNSPTAWFFYYGDQYDGTKYNMISAWAVRDGDSTPVPEPATMLLLVSGLVGLAAGFRKLRKN